MSVTNDTSSSVSFHLDGLRVLITGAGLGRRMAEEFAVAGAGVVLNDLDAESVHAMVTDIGHGTTVAVGDVADEDAARQIVQTAEAHLGGIDVLVNNAGIADQVLATVDQDVDAWQRVIDVHLRGTYLMSREVGRPMLRAGRGSIVNLASIAGLVGLPGRNAYSAAKAGTVMMTRTLAAEWGGSGVRVNAIAPGYVLTPLVEALVAQGRVRTDALIGRTPLGRFGWPEEIARCALFLASDAASFVTGATLAVDGGWTAVGGELPAAPENEA